MAGGSDLQVSNSPRSALNRARRRFQNTYKSMTKEVTDSCTAARATLHRDDEKTLRDVIKRITAYKDEVHTCYIETIQALQEGGHSF